MKNTNGHSRQHSSRKSQHGVTLIELMVAITISLFLLGGVIQIFASNKQVYRVQDASARIQESGRFALHFLTRDIRMADFWGCMGGFPDVNNHVNPGAGNPFDGMTGGIAGSDNTGLNGSDVLDLFGGFGNGITITGNNVMAASFSIPADTVIDIEQFDYMLVTDCTKADLSQRTNINNLNAAVVGNTGVGTPGNATRPGIGYQQSDGATLFEFRGTTYSLATGSGGTETSLYRTINGGTPVELVEGVEDMQILYGEDSIDGDESADRYLPAGTAGLDMDRVVSIRITLTIRSAEDNVNINQNNGDYRLRRTFTSTTTIRNRVS
jgi:type IV pilus assembly protein PilW